MSKIKRLKAKRILKRAIDEASQLIPIEEVRLTSDVLIKEIESFVERLRTGALT